MRTPYGEDGRVRGYLRYPHRDNGYSDDPVGDAVCDRLTLVQLAQEWAAAVAALETPEPRTRHNRSMRQNRALSRENAQVPKGTGSPVPSVSLRGQR